MPILPKGLSPDLFNRIKQRIQTEFGGGKTEPNQSSNAPGVTNTVENVDEPLDKSLWQKIKDRAKKLLGLEPKPEKDDGPLTPETLKFRIRECARLKVLLLASYQAKHSPVPVFRMLEPYSYRTKKNGQLYLYCFCRLHNQVECFKLERFSAARVTSEPFTPQWPIEIS